MMHLHREPSPLCVRSRSDHLDLLVELGGLVGQERLTSASEASSPEQEDLTSWSVRQHA